MNLGKAHTMASKDKHVDILVLDDDIDLLVFASHCMSLAQIHAL